MLSPPAIEKTTCRGLEAYRLQNGRFTVYAAPGQGMNLCLIEADGHTLVQPDLQRMEKGATWGFPVLYPTPNRVSGGGIRVGGRLLPLEYRGAPVLIHGAAKNMPFRVEEAACRDGCALLRGALDFLPGSEAYAYFPFESVLRLEAALYPERLEIRYSVRNLGPDPLPFGLGFHPFFQKLGGARIRTGARRVYATGDDKLPTGETFEARGPFDLSDWREVDALELDHVYTGLPAGEETALLDFPAAKLRLALCATAEFSHLVVYTPTGMPYFCVENQTCSTDCHNLSAKAPFTGLQTVAPGTECGGRIALELRV